MAPTLLVSGSSRGLGRGVAVELARAGCSVVIHAGRNRAAAEATAEECRNLAGGGQRFPIVVADLSDDMARRALFAEAVQAAGGQIDGFVSNAGIPSPGRRDMVEADESSFDAVMAVNVRAAHFLAQECARHWLARPGLSRLPGGYRLVFVSSVSATLASTNRADYCMSKAALAMCAQAWALRLAEHGVQVVEVRPGIMETDMTAAVREKYDPLIEAGVVPQRRWGQPQDVARAVRSIVEGDWPFSTGAVITVDGGLSLGRL